jgi:hypothetical protein
MDPLSLVVLGAAATQTITFLYSQVGELLKARRERQARPDAPAEVPLVDPSVLDRPLTSTRIDAEVLDREADSLVGLSAALAPVASGHVELDPNDPVIAMRAAQLRALLEAIYGQRITFRGEERAPSGSQVDVVQLLGDVSGAVTGSESDVGSGGHLTVKQRTTTVAPGATVTGHRGRIGGG